MIYLFRLNSNQATIVSKQQEDTVVPSYYTTNKLNTINVNNMKKTLFEPVQQQGKLFYLFYCFFLLLEFKFLF